MENNFGREIKVSDEMIIIIFFIVLRIDKR